MTPSTSGTSTPAVNGGKKPYTLTPAQLEKQRLRQEAKLAAKSAPKPAVDENELRGLGKDGKPLIRKRNWYDIRAGKTLDRDDFIERQTARKQGEEAPFNFRILSWNMLAQTLVRRTLFPGSDCLKWKDREAATLAEMKAYPADVVCLQEVDRIDLVLPNLPEGFRYSSVRANGPGKLHGLVILFREDRFRVKEKKVVNYDLSEISALDDSASPSDLATDATPNQKQSRRKARGGTRLTRNIGLIVSLERIDKPGSGVIIATTHLFWHPQYAYERTRQALILSKEVLAFRQRNQEMGSDCPADTWPVFIAGDFNTQPSEATYQLLTHPELPLSKEQVDAIDFGRAVHASLEKVEMYIDQQQMPTPVAPTTVISTDTHEEGENEKKVQEMEDEEEEEEEEAEEKAGQEEEDPTMPKNSRKAIDSDGLLTADQLQEIARKLFGQVGAQSGYGSSGWATNPSLKDLAYGGRGGESSTGSQEPNWSSFTPLWRLTLGEYKTLNACLLVLTRVRLFVPDYILRPPSTSNTTPAEKHLPHKILLPHKTQDMEPGLPKKGVCASDHTLIGAEYEI